MRACSSRCLTALRVVYMLKELISLHEPDLGSGVKREQRHASPPRRSGLGSMAYGMLHASRGR